MFETPLELVQPAMSRGEVSPDLFGRVDLQAYGSGLRTSRNAFIKTEGDWSNRPGFGLVDNAGAPSARGSIMVPFVFNTGQAYAIEIVGGIGGNPGQIQVYFQGATIASPGLLPPYQVSELAAVRYTQSADTLTLFHQNYPPYEFKRTSANTFTLAQATFTFGPFLTQNTDGVTFVKSSGVSGAVTLTASSAIFNPNHVGALFQLQQQDLSLIPPWEPGKIIASSVAASIGVFRRSNGKNYVSVGPQGTPGTNNVTTGTIAPDHLFGTQADGDGGLIPNGGVNNYGVNWLYQDSGTGIVLITGYISPTQVSGIVQPNYQGGPGLLPQTVVGGPQVAFGPFPFTTSANQTAFTGLTGITSADPTRFFITANGVYQAPSTYSVNLGATTINFQVGFVAGVSVSIEQITALGQTTFWQFGAFSKDQGYPGAGTYYPDRLVMGGTRGQPVGLFASQTSNYHNFGVSNPVVNSDGFTVFLNARQLNAITDLIPLQDLIVGTSGIMWRIYPGPQGNALGPLSIAALPQGFIGEHSMCAAVLYADSLVYPTYGGRRLRDMLYQFQFDKYMGQELTAYSRHLFPFGTTITRLAYAPEPWTQIFALRSDGQLMTCTYVREQQMIAWSRWDTGPDGDPDVIEDICVIPENNSYALYALISRTIAGNFVRTVERLSQWEVSNNLDWSFADCALKYDGRNTSAATMALTGGTSWLAGDTGTLSASSLTGWATFVAQDVADKNVIRLYDEDGNLARVLITGITNAGIAQVRFMDPIPATLQNTPTLTWTFARTRFGNQTQLAGATVSVLADCMWVGGSNGVPTVTVDSSGTLTLPNAAGVVTSGLQYFSDFETLALNLQGQMTIRERAKGIPSIYLDVTNTRGLLVGTSFNKLTGIKERAFEPYTSPTDVQEGILQTRIESGFDSEIHICVRQPYPLPATIRMVIPQISVGEPVG